MIVRESSYQSACKVGAIGNFSDSNSKNAESFAALPSMLNPRWIIPLKNKELFISSLALYQPSLFRARALKKLTILLAEAGLAELFARHKVYFTRRDPEVRQIFGRDDLNYAVFTGTEGHHRKITIQVMDGEGAILGYMKVADSGEIALLLHNEAETLAFLSRSNIRSGLFPRVLYRGIINDKTVEVLDTAKSRRSTFSSRLVASHTDFLAEIFQKALVRVCFRESGFAAGLKKRIAALRPGIDDAWRKRYDRAIDRLDSVIGAMTIPFGLCHRDFTPWNTFFHDGRLYVFDWEYSMKEYPPLFDIFHFIIQDGIIVRKCTPARLMRKVLTHEKLIAGYCETLRLERSLQSSLLLAYLTDISLLYRARGDGLPEPCVLLTIETWGRMIDILLNEKTL